MQDQPRTSGADQQVTSSETARTGIWSRFSAEALKLVGGLVALAVGLLVLCLIAAGAFIADPGHAGSIATAAFGVIGSIVGAYFGVKIGTDGTKEALEAHQTEADKAQIFAAHLSSELANEVLAQAGLMPDPPTTA